MEVRRRWKYLVNKLHLITPSLAPWTSSPEKNPRNKHIRDIMRKPGLCWCHYTSHNSQWVQNTWPCTQAGVLRALLCDHDGLVLLAVELQQTFLVTEMLHLCSPHHGLRQIALHLAAVAARRLVATRRFSVRTFLHTYTEFDTGHGEPERTL